MYINWHEVFESVEKAISDKHKFLAQHSGKKVALFCAGVYAQKAHFILESLSIDVEIFIDNDENLNGTVIFNKPVRYRPWEDDAFFKEQYIIFVASSPKNYVSISKQLDELQVTYSSYDAVAVSLFWNRYESILPLLNDEQSKHSYLAALYYLLTYDNRYILYSDDQYFAVPGFLPSDEDIVIDAGAYNGDTLEQYINKSSGKLKKIYAFEPFNSMYDILKSRANRLLSEWNIRENLITLENAGLGIKTELLRYSLKSDSLYISDPNGKISIQTYCIDDYFKDKPFTLLKADIESGELDMLKGGRKFLQKNSPKVAIAIYHTPVDLYSIIEYLSSITEDYKFAVRNHSKTYEDTVLYCWKE